jgi:hypothetical protein
MNGRTAKLINRASNRSGTEAAVLKREWARLPAGQRAGKRRELERLLRQPVKVLP